MASSPCAALADVRCINRPTNALLTSCLEEVFLGSSDGMNSALAKKKGQSYAARTSACSTITVTKSGEPVLSGKTVSQVCASVSVEGNVNT